MLIPIAAVTRTAETFPGLGECLGHRVAGRTCRSGDPRQVAPRPGWTRGVEIPQVEAHQSLGKSAIDAVRNGVGYRAAAGQIMIAARAASARKSTTTRPHDAPPARSAARRSSRR